MMIVEYLAMLLNLYFTITINFRFSIAVILKQFMNEIEDGAKRIIINANYYDRLNTYSMYTVY